MTIRELIQKFNPEMKNITGIRKYAECLNEQVTNYEVMGWRDGFYVVINRDNNTIGYSYWESKTHHQPIFRRFMKGSIYK